MKCSKQIDKQQAAVAKSQYTISTL